jgi:hypothetical protein
MIFTDRPSLHELLNDWQEGYRDFLRDPDDPHFILYPEEIRAVMVTDSIQPFGWVCKLGFSGLLGLDG